MLNLINSITKEIDKYEKINLIVSGGNSPLKFLNFFLASKKKLLKKINFIISDERILKSNKKEFNHRKISAIFKRHKIKKKIFSFNKNFLKPKIKNKFLNLIKKNKNLSVIGIGEDGHFASIFPNSKKAKLLLNSKYKPNIYLTEKLGNPNCKRITINLSLLLRSKKIFIILNTAKKKLLIKKLSIKKTSKIPVFKLLNTAKKKLAIFDANSFKLIK